LVERLGGNLAEALKEVASKTPEEFAVLCTGEPNFDAQKMACEIKLLDAVFEAALAPYNYAEVTSEDGRPFEKISGSGAPRALQKFLHVTLQRMVTSNLVSQNYFAHRRSRMWVRRAHAPSFVQEDCHSPLAVLPLKRRSLRELTFGALQSVSSLGSSTDTAESKDFNDLLPIKAMSLKSVSRCFTFSSAEEGDNDDEFEFNGVYSTGDAVISKPVSRVKNQPQKTKYHIERKWDLWRNIIVEQVSDSMGVSFSNRSRLKVHSCIIHSFLFVQAAVTLRQLLMSNEKIVSKLVNEELMDRFKTLGEPGIFISYPVIIKPRISFLPHHYFCYLIFKSSTLDLSTGLSRFSPLSATSKVALPSPTKKCVCGSSGWTLKTDTRFVSRFTKLTFHQTKCRSTGACTCRLESWPRQKENERRPKTHQKPTSGKRNAIVIYRYV
jgi:hypothetical protein